MAKNFTHNLILRVGTDVDRTEFEPDASWACGGDDVIAYVVQSVRIAGDRIVGASGVYSDRLVDVVADTDYFVSLTAW